MITKGTQFQRLVVVFADGRWKSPGVFFFFFFFFGNFMGGWAKGGGELIYHRRWGQFVAGWLISTARKSIFFLFYLFRSCSCVVCLFVLDLLRRGHHKAKGKSLMRGIRVPCFYLSLIQGMLPAAIMDSSKKRGYSNPSENTARATLSRRAWFARTVPLRAGMVLKCPSR